MKVIWSPLAVEQAQDIASYIALDKPSVAKQWIDEIFDSVTRLADFPESGRVVPEIKRKNIREIVQGNYRIIYKVTNNSINVLIVKNYYQQLKHNEII